MSALGDLLKELFPIRGMGDQIFGQARTDQFVKFGSSVATQIKGVTVSTVSAAVAKAKAFGNVAGQAGSNAMTGVQQYLSNLLATIKANSPLIRQIAASVTRGFGRVAASGLGLAVRGGIGAVRGLAGAAIGAVKTPFTMTAKVVSGITGFADKISQIGLRIAVIKYLLDSATGLFKRFTTGLVDSNRDLARWNGGIQASFNQLDVLKMHLEIQQGKAVRGSASELNNQLGILLQEVQPIREGIATVTNVIGINLLKIATASVQTVKEFAKITPWLKGVVDAIDKIEEELKKKGNDKFLGNQTLQGLTHLADGNKIGKGAGVVPPLVPKHKFPIVNAPPLPHNNQFLRRHKEGKRR